MPENNTTPPGSGRWKRLDPHLQRWAALATIGVTVVPLVVWSFHHYSLWPFNAPSEQSHDQVKTQVRYQSPDWLQNVEVRGVDPIFEVQVEFENISQVRVNDVVLKLDYPPNAHPILGVATMITGTFPNGTLVPDDMVGDNGMNIGSYEANSNAHIRQLFHLDYRSFPCGKTPIPFKTSLRIGTSSFDGATYSSDAVVTYNRPCP